MRKESLHAAFFFLVLVTLFVLAFLVLRPVLDFMLMGFLLAVGFWPLQKGMRRAVGSDGLGAFLTMLIASALVVIPMVLVALSLMEDVATLVADLDLADLEGSLTAALGGTGTGLTATLVQVVVPHVAAFLEALVADIGDIVARAAVGLMVLAFVLFYALAEGPDMVERLRGVLPLKRVHKDKLVLETRNAVNAIFFGQILISVVHGVVLGLGFAFFGLPNPVFWGFVTIIVSILPVVGTPAIWIPAGLWVWVHSGPAPAIGFMVYAAVVSTGLVEHWLKLRLIGRMAQIHPLIVLVGVIGGIAAFGMSGFLFGPLILALLVVFLRTFSDSYDEDENYLFL